MAGKGGAQEPDFLQALRAALPNIIEPSEDPPPNTQAYQRNRQYSDAPPSSNGYQAPFDSMSELNAFTRWRLENNVPYDASSTSDYDMVSFWRALKNGDPNASTGVNPNDNALHFSDYFKTPYHQSFSRESRFARDGAPSWNAKDQLVLPNGTIVFDEKKAKR